MGKDLIPVMQLSTSSIKRLLIGHPFPTRADIDERLDKVRGLAIFASDPISSNAYATEAIMTVLVLMGSGAPSMKAMLAANEHKVRRIAELQQQGIIPSQIGSLEDMLPSYYANPRFDAPAELRESGE